VARTKALVVIGTRPEAIKLAPLVLELQSRPGEFSTTVAATAQHREMLDQVLELFGIVPDFDLDLMRPRQRLDEVLARAVTGLYEVMEADRPDVVLVQGDTATTFAGALAAFYHKIPVGHVEAGLRTGDRYRPFPEEINRRLTTQVTDWHFAPTDHSRDRLLAEGIDPAAVFVTGNTVVDALLRVADQPYTWAPGPVAEALASGRRIVLMTAHRRENWDDGIAQACGAVQDLLARFDDIHVLFSVHRNPAVRETVESALSGLDRVSLLPPLDYLPFVQLMKACTLILSDSGGVQEEAPSLGKPALVLRDVTERPEAIDAGVVKLVGTDRARIVEEASLLLSDPAAYSRMAQASNPFGDGTASRRIADVLAKELM
jgi:UDP-N-acetylglucosamine 2-epimerase (non-hydrolysing)